MADEHYRIINRAIAHLDHRGNAELQDLREAARTALHHIFGREKKLREEREEAMQYAREGVESEQNLVIENANLAAELANLREECAERHVRGSDVLDLRKDNARLTAELARLREEKAQAGKTMMRLMDVIGEAEAELDRLREAPCDLHTELREENARLRKQHRQEQDHRIEAEDERDRLREEMRLRTELLNQELDRLREQLAEAVTRLEDADHHWREIHGVHTHEAML